MTLVITRAEVTASSVSMGRSPFDASCHRVRGIKFRPDFPERRDSLY
jgi:hypothetical protein